MLGQGVHGYGLQTLLKVVSWLHVPKQKQKKPGRPGPLLGEQVDDLVPCICIYIYIFGECVDMHPRSSLQVLISDASLSTAVRLCEVECPQLLLHPVQDVEGCVPRPCVKLPLELGILDNLPHLLLILLSIAAAQLSKLDELVIFCQELGF